MTYLEILLYFSITHKGKGRNHEARRASLATRGDRIEKTNMKRFIEFVNEKRSMLISNYNELWQWSVDNIPEFWEDFWEFSKIIHSKPPQEIVDDPYKLPRARWFIGAELNFAQNLLRMKEKDKTALISVTETGRIKKDFLQGALQ